MHGEYKVKFIDAQQAKTIHKFQRIKEKIHKTKAAIWFNKLCKTEHLTPRCINITVKGNTQRSRNTQKLSAVVGTNKSVRDHVLHPYNTTGKIVFLYILIITFFYSKLENKRFWTE
jgi:hypothetical protein